MAYQAIFKRYELKYMLTRQQKEILLEAMKPYMALDAYGRTTIRNIYYDTDNYRLIRRSIEKPEYKEKLRVRSYRQVSAEENVFVELKKKYKSVVYKRRLHMPQEQAQEWLATGQREAFPVQSKVAEFGQREVQSAQRKGQQPRLDESYATAQISAEIDYFLQYYETLHPVLFLSYEREAYYALDGGDFRVTFDDHILCRQEDLSLTAEVRGEFILEEDKVLMEIKCSGGIPLWMTEVLSREKLYKTSFSKYGTAYQNIIFPKLKEGMKNA